MSRPRFGWQTDGLPAQIANSFPGTHRLRDHLAIAFPFWRTTIVPRLLRVGQSPTSPPSLFGTMRTVAAPAPKRVGQVMSWSRACGRCTPLCTPSHANVVHLQVRSRPGPPIRTLAPRRSRKTASSGSLICARAYDLAPTSMDAVARGIPARLRCVDLSDDGCAYRLVSVTCILQHVSVLRSSLQRSRSVPSTPPGRAHRPALAWRAGALPLPELLRHPGVCGEHRHPPADGAALRAAPDASADRGRVPEPTRQRV